LQGLELKPRLGSEIVDAAFQLYRRHFTDLITLSALTFGVYAILQLALTGGAPPQGHPISGMVGVLLVLGWIFGSLSEAAIVVAVSNIVVTGEADVPGALRRTLGRLGAVLVASTVKWLVTGFAFAVALMIGIALGAVVLLAAGGPGAGVTGLTYVMVAVSVLVGLPVALYFFARYFAIPATVVVDNLGVRAALRRSRALSKNSKRKIIATLGLPIAFFFALQAIVSAILVLLPGPDVVHFLIGQAVTIVGYPILSVIATLLYYDARIRQEGFDIEMMAAELEGARPTRAGEPVDASFPGPGA
jgi:hypothetical protein